ncbi:MAG TPA: phosphoribosyltransferase [Gemmatimonadaceae bacterium]|nr:phosphoribosyltransferase [Gemmatimonadaceae bacterium]
MAERFRNRTEAGRRLAADLTGYAGRSDVRVLALPRGGVPVAFEVARALDAPLDVFVVRKLGLPGHEEFAMGAIASGDVVMINEQVVRATGVSRAAIERVLDDERRELARREELYRGSRPPVDVEGNIIILVDDGLATGASMFVAVEAVKRERPARVVVAVPVAARETCDALRRQADEVVCSMTPEPFHAVGLWYDDFSQTSDDEVHELLELSRSSASPR